MRTKSLHTYMYICIILKVNIPNIWIWEHAGDDNVGIVELQRTAEKNGS
jgi:hypothetical protein